MNLPTTRRFVANSAVLFWRTAVLVALGLLATRWILGALGPVQFGVLTALTAATLIVRPIGASLTYGAMRQLAALSAHEIDEQREVIGVFLGVGVLVGLVVLAAVVFGGDLILRRVDLGGVRVSDAMTVLLLLLGANCLNLVVVAPFRAYLSVSESFQVLSLWDVLQSVVLVAGALIASGIAPEQRLTAFAWTQLAGLSLLTTGFVVRCVAAHPSSRPKLASNRTRLSQRMGTTAAWHFLGELAIWARTQSATLVLNFVYGPTVNGAFAIATRVDDASDRVGRPVADAIRPALLRASASPDPQAAIPLLVGMNRFATATAALLLLPVLIETETVLSLWLGQAPPWAILFVQLAVIGRMSQFVSLGHVHLMAGRNALSRLTVLTALPQLVGVVALLYLTTALRPPTWFLPLTLSVVAMLVSLVVQPVVVQRFARVPLAATWRAVLAPTLLTIALAVMVGLAVRFALPAGPLRLVLVSIGTTIMMCAGTYAIVLSSDQRAMVRDEVRKRRAQLFGST